MRVMAQMAMVMNLDKCIGCHTCSVTCKQAWTNRSGTEYVWFNNVETRPGTGLSAHLRGPGPVARAAGCATERGRLRLRDGGRMHKLLRIFSNPKLPSIDDYYEPWTYDYENLTTAPLGEHMPVAPPRSLISGKPMKVSWSANWDDDLGGSPEIVPGDPVLKKVSEQVRLELEQTFMFYLPRICEHCLNPSCVASCPSGAMYKRTEDGIVLVDQDRCRGLADVRVRMPVQEGVFQPQDRQGREVHLLLSARRSRAAHGVRRDLRGTVALHRAGALRRGPGARGGVGREATPTCTRRNARSCSTPPTRR